VANSRCTHTILVKRQLTLSIDEDYADSETSNANHSQGDRPNLRLRLAIFILRAIGGCGLFMHAVSIKKTGMQLAMLLCRSIRTYLETTRGCFVVILLDACLDPEAGVTVKCFIDEIICVPVR
jgi:hypothetical protein